MKQFSVKDIRNTSIAALSIFCIMTAAVIFAILLSCVVHTDNIFSKIPGEDTEWFGFWASYLGALVSIVIAWLTWKNQKKLEDINKENEKLKNAVNRTIVGVNLRLRGVEIRPLGVDLTGKKVAYHMTFRFDNKANALLDDMLLEKITFGDNKNSFKLEDLDFKYKLQNNTPILDGEITLEPFSQEEKVLTNFYFYYSQFLPDSRNLNLDLEIMIKIDSENERRIKMLAQLEILPKFDNSSYSNAIMVNHYKIIFL